MGGVTKSAPTHAPVTLGVGSDPALALAGQELTLAPGAAHAPVTLGPGSDLALALVGQQLTLADVLTPAEHTAIGDAAPHHAPVTIGADVEHSLVGQVLSGVDAAAAQKGHIQLAGELGGTAALPTITAIHSGSAHHVPVTLGGGSDAALALAGQQLTLADVLTPAEHTAIGDGAPHHAAITLGGGSDPALALAGQQLTLADVLTPAEHTAIGDGAPHHAPVTIGVDAEHSLLGQVLSGVDAAAAQKGHIQLAGQLGGTAALPDVRGLRETVGPTLLTMGAVADGEFLQRSGANVVGAAGGGAPANASYVTENAEAGLADERVLGTTVITTTTEALRQAAASAGRLFLPSDGFYVERDTGAAWAPWGPIFPMTPPVSGDFAWINQGGASIDTTYGGIHLYGPADAAINLRIRKKAAPATPYTISCAFLPHLHGVNNNSCGLLWRESASGKVGTLEFLWAGSFQLHIRKWTNETTYSASYLALGGLSFINLVWLQISDDGVNRICRWSNDGQHWYVLHTVARADFLTADEVGFMVHAQNATWPAAMTLLSWKQT